LKTTQWSTSPLPEGISLDHVSVAYGGRRVLCDIDVQLGERRIGVIGANGSGKSTFARLLNGLTLPSQGHVLIDGLDTRRMGKMVRRKVGFVFQNPDNQIVMPVVEEDLAFGLKNLKLSQEEIARRIDEVLARYGISMLKPRPTHLLSGGQKQLLAICSVLVMEPEMIVFDEPTTQLDLRHKKHINALIETLPQRVVVVSHDLDSLHHFDRVLLFDCGRIVCDASPAEAIARYERLMA